MTLISFPGRWAVDKWKATSPKIHGWLSWKAGGGELSGDLWSALSRASSYIYLGGIGNEFLFSYIPPLMGGRL